MKISIPSASSIVGGLVGVFVIGSLIAMVYSMANPGPSPHVSGPAWNNNMLMGSADAPNKVVEYSDYFCSHCAEFHHAAGDDFKRDFIEPKKVGFEMRMINLLGDQVPNTNMGVDAAYCAADQKKFWEYTHEIIVALEKDYFSKKIGIGPGYPQIEKLPVEYFVKPAATAGLNTREFETCVTTEKFASEIAANTAKAQSLGVNALPQINVNNFQTSGFQGGYDQLKTLLKAGGVKFGD